MRQWIDLFEENADAAIPEWQKIITKLKTLPYADSITVFGSIARGDARASSDVDIFVSSEDAPRQLLSMAQKYYGMIDVFYEENGVLMVRSDDARSFVPAKQSRAIRAAIRQGVPLISLD